MQQTEHKPAETGRGSRRGAQVVLVIAALASLIGVTAAAAWQLTQPPLTGLEFPDPLAHQLSAVTDLLTRYAMIGTMAFLLASVLFAPVKRSHHALSDSGRELVRGAAWMSGLWFIGSLLMTLFTAARNNGVDVPTAAAALNLFLASTQNAAAWLCPAFVAWIFAIIGRRAKTTGPVGVMMAMSLFWSLAPVVSGNVSVGRDHDFGTDAAIYATTAATLWAAAAGAALLADQKYVGTRPWSLRYQWFALVASPFVLAGWGVVAWYEMAGDPWTTGYGVVTAISLALWGVLTIRAIIAAVRRVPRTRLSLIIDFGLLLMALAGRAAMDNMYPPRFREIQSSSQINYLGYELPNSPHWYELLLPARPNVLFATVAIGMVIAYTIAVYVLHRRGVKWPASRTFAWYVGWIVVVFWLSVMGLWQNSGVSLAYHMVVHMTVTMIGPVFIVAGAPLTLALRLLGAAKEGEMGSPRAVLQGMLSWPPMGVVMHPVVVSINFVGSLYLIYFTDIFESLMRYHWGHQFMTIHLMISGLMFFGLLVGADRMQHELPYIAKLGMLFAAMPFHAFFAVILMQADTIIAKNFFDSLDLTWITDRYVDQNLAGQVTWALGDIPMLIVVIYLVIQWVQQDQREAARIDRALDEDIDNAHAAYNEMLRQLNERAEREQR